MDEEQALWCGRIRLHDGKLEEMREDGPVVTVPIAEVEEARVTRIQLAERPIIQGVLGLGLIALGVVFAIRVLLWLDRGGGIIDAEIVMVGWLVAGPLVLYGAVRRGVVLRVRTRTTTRKLIVGKEATVDDLRSFAERARAEHGVTIALDLEPR